MPRVPTYDGPQLREQALPGAFQSAEAFGATAGRQQAALGEALANTATKAMQVFDAKLEKLDIMEATKREEDMQADLSAFELSVAETRQQDKANGVGAEAQDFWAKLNEKHSAGLSERANAVLQKRISHVRQNSLARMAQFEVNELDKAWVSTNQNQQNLAIQRAAKDPANAASEYQQFNADFRLFSTDMQRRGVWNEAQAKVEYTNASTKFHTAVVQSLIAAKKPEEAMLYFDTAGASVEQFNPVVANEIRDKIKHAADVKKGDDLAGSVLHLLPQKALAVINANPDKEVTKVARDTFMRKVQDMSVLKRIDEEDAAKAAWPYFEQGNRPPAALWDRVGWRERENFTKYATARATAEVGNGGRLHAKEDDYEVLGEIERSIAAGEFKRPDDINKWAVQLKDSTFHNLRKAIANSGNLNIKKVEDAFSERMGKSKAKWIKDSDAVAKWNSFKEYAYTDVSENRRPGDLDELADRFFNRSGYLMSDDGSKKGLFFNDYTMAEAKKKGAANFVFTTPKDAAPQVEQALNYTRRLFNEKAPGTGAKAFPLMQGEGSVDLFYTNVYADAQRLAQAYGLPVSDKLAAYAAVLKIQKLPLTKANIDYVAGQFAGAESSLAAQDAKRKTPTTQQPSAKPATAAQPTRPQTPADKIPR